MTLDQVTQVTFIALIFIPALIILGGVIYACVVVMPTALRQIQQLIDNNTQLTKITKESAEGFGGMKAELVKQTTAIEKQSITVENTNEAIKTQGIDFRSYQTLMSDGFKNFEDSLGGKVEANTTAIRALQKDLEAMPLRIILAIKDEPTCAKILAEFQSLRSEIARASFQQQTRATGSFPVSVPSTSTPTQTPPPPSLPPEKATS